MGSWQKYHKYFYFFIILHSYLRQVYWRRILQQVSEQKDCLLGQETGCWCWYWGLHLLYPKVYQKKSHRYWPQEHFRRKKKKSNMFRPIHSSTISAKFQTNKRLTLCYGYSTHRLTTRILSKKIHRVLNFYIENLNGDKCFTDGW